MAARLILMLLLACLTLPAMARAPCHDVRGGDGSAAMAGMAMDRGAPAPAHEHKAVPAHSCLGCIPPVTLMRFAIAGPARVEALLLRVDIVRFAAGRSSPPATPPPRVDA